MKELGGQTFIKSIEFLSVHGKTDHLPQIGDYLFGDFKLPVIVIISRQIFALISDAKSKPKY